MVDSGFLSVVNASVRAYRRVVIVVVALSAIDFISLVDALTRQHVT